METTKYRSDVEEWQDILKIFPPDWNATVVGGAVRDHILGKPVKDIDVFISANSRDVMALVKKHFPDADWYHGHPVSSEEEADAMYEKTGFLAEVINAANRRYQFIVTYDYETPESMVARVDFGVCAVGYNLRQGLIVERRFCSDVAHMTLTASRHTEKREAKMREKFPGWKVVANEVLF